MFDQAACGVSVPNAKQFRHSPSAKPQDIQKYYLNSKDTNQVNAAETFIHLHLTFFSHASSSVLQMTLSGCGSSTLFYQLLDGLP